jgi:hypothetical protein
MQKVRDRLVKTTIVYYLISLVLFFIALNGGVDVSLLIYLIPYVGVLYTVDYNNRKIHDVYHNYFKEGVYVFLQLTGAIFTYLIGISDGSRSNIGNILVFVFVFMWFGYFIASAYRKVRLNKASKQF